MRDIATPEAHQPWCHDRFAVRSQDHLSAIGADRCASEVTHVGDSWMFLTEGEDDQPVLMLDGVERPLAEALEFCGRLDAGAQMLAALAAIDGFRSADLCHR